MHACIMWWSWHVFPKTHSIYMYIYIYIYICTVIKFPQKLQECDSTQLKSYLGSNLECKNPSLEFTLGRPDWHNKRTWLIHCLPTFSCFWVHYLRDWEVIDIFIEGCLWGRGNLRQSKLINLLIGRTNMRAYVQPILGPVIVCGYSLQLALPCMCLQTWEYILQVIERNENRC